MSEAVIRRFEPDPRLARSVAALRLGAGLIVGAAGLSILASGPGAVGSVLGLLGLGACAGWTYAFVRWRRRRAGASADFLELRDGSLLLADGGRRHHVPWVQVQGVEVDEDRLVVRLLLEGGPPMLLEPCYRGVGVHELCHAVRAAWQRASRPPECFNE